MSKVTPIKKVRRPKTLPFANMRIGQKFLSGNIVWTKVNKKEARAQGAIAIFYTPMDFELVR